MQDAQLEVGSDGGGVAGGIGSVPLQCVGGNLGQVEGHGIADGRALQEADKRPGGM